MAIPFFLAHPRLERLEQSQMLAVEGGEHEWCMRILRHEAGHVVDNAYKLRRRRQRRALFGSSSVAYPEFYTPKPYSKSFVLHLDPWYAQSHPDEDFAETFAVWLTPQSNWQQRYAGWPAMKKLEYMDALMRSLAGRPPQVASADEVESARGACGGPCASTTSKRRRHYGVDHPAFYDRDLRRLFSDAPEHHDRADRGAVHRSAIAERAAAGRRVDRDLSIHHRQGHRRHDCPCRELKLRHGHARGSRRARNSRCC